MNGPVESSVELVITGVGEGEGFSGAYPPSLPNPLAASTHAQSQ